MLHKPALILSLSLLLIGCPPPGPIGNVPNLGNNIVPTASANPPDGPSGNPQGGPAPDGPGAPPQPGATATPGSTGSGTGLISRFELRLANRFLSIRGETVRIEVLAFDAAGNPINPGALLFSSSRPQDFSVDATGLITALTDDGFAEIRASLGNLSAVIMISVASQVTGGSGGGGSTEPAEEQVRGTVGYSFAESPALTFINPGSGAAGSNVTLTGSGFRGEAGVHTVLVGGVEATILGIDEDSITFQAPAGLIGEQDVTVTIGGQTSNVLSFSYPIGEFQVNTLTAENQNTSSVAMDADGDFVICYEGKDGSDLGIFAQRFRSDGTPQGPEFLVNTYTTNHQRVPDVAMDANGDFVITWGSFIQDGSSYGIYARRFTAAGVPQGSEFRVNSYTTNIQTLPSIASDADGDFVITWASTVQDNSLDGVFAQRYNSTGVAQGSEFQVNSYTTGNQNFPNIGMDADGDFVIAWESNGQDGNFGGIYAQRINPVGAFQGSEFRVNTYTMLSQADPEVALDVDGDFIITWTDFSLDGSSLGIFARLFHSDGSAPSTEFKVNSYTIDFQGIAAVASTAAGDFIITWSSDDQDGDSLGIFAQRFNPAGQTLGSEFRVNTVTTNVQTRPSVAVDFDGDFIITWDGVFGGNYDVHAKRYSAAGEAQ
ncbi:MAG: IPT/TIG domain-containing protein [Candidatus Sericytochromatia bacterium]